MDTDQIETVVEDAVQRHRERPGALLPLLHDIQDALGYIPPDAVGRIARALNLSRAEVHGVITFYHHFRSAPAGRHVVRVCQAEACQSMGAARLTEHARRTLGCDLHSTSADGSFTLEPTYCLGLCAMSPSVSIDDEVHARLTPQGFDRLLEEVRGKDATGAQTP